MIQPLQDRVHPICEYNGLDDATQTIRGHYDEGKPLRKMLSLMFKGKAANFPNEMQDAGFSALVPMQGVRHLSLPFLLNEQVHFSCL